MDIGTQSEPASQRGGGGVGRCHPGRRPRRGTAQGERTLGPGEVRIDGGSSSVYLGRGRLELTGNVYINGKNLADLIPGLKK